MLEPEFVSGGAVYPYTEYMANQYTLMSKFDEPFRMWREFPGGRMMIPRNCAPLANDRREEGREATSFKNNFKPRFAEQERLVMQSVALLDEDISHILQAPTGYGKTYLGCAIAALIKKRTMVITTKEDIIEQWIKAANDVLGITDIGVWRGDYTPKVNQQFVVGLVQSVMKGPDRYGSSPYQGFGLVICDEVHRMGADHFSQAMWWYKAKLRLGLSATPYRKDGREKVFHGHIGKTRVVGKQETMIPKILIQKTKYKLPLVQRHGRMMQIPHKAGRTMHINKLLGKDYERNMLIANFVASAVKADRHTIVFADIIAHLEELYDRFYEEGVSPNDMGYYVGLSYYKGPSEERKKFRNAVKSKKVILATYKMVSEATDIPWLDTAVLATPRSDVVQIVGRIRREYEGKPQPIVLDLVDEDSRIFRAYAGKRMQWYRSLGCPIKIY